MMEGRRDEGGKKEGGREGGKEAGREGEMKREKGKKGWQDVLREGGDVKFM